MEREGGPLQIAAFSKPLPKASTPLSQNSPSFVLDRTLSMPSQPEFSHVGFYYRYIRKNGLELFLPFLISSHIVV